MIPASTRRTVLLAGSATLALGLVAGACGSSSTKTSQQPLVGSVTTSGISADRCAANKAAGKITYLSGFDFAASASIIDVVTAKEKGYFDKMCLDVDLKGSFTTANYPLLASGQAQFASAGSYSEIVDFGQADKTTFVAAAVEGHTAIDALLARDDGKINTLADVKGTTVGVKGKITPAVKTMLAKQGLVEGKDYKTVLLDGFDPKVHIKLVESFPVYKSNEPGQLDAAGIKYKLFDPSTEGIPGSFGVIVTTQAFLAAHPTAVQDFVRASMKGLADAEADPAASVAYCLALIKANGNKNFLSQEGETYRWSIESKLVTDSSAGKPLGFVDEGALQSEVDQYASAGIWATKPSTNGTTSDLVSGVYDSHGTVIWPAS